jgi:hypothetical protein
MFRDGTELLKPEKKNQSNIIKQSGAQWNQLKESQVHALTLFISKMLIR